MKSSMALRLFSLLSSVFSASNRTASCGPRRDTLERVKGAQAAIFCIAYRFSCGRKSGSACFAVRMREFLRGVGGHLLEVSFSASWCKGLLAC